MLGLLLLAAMLLLIYAGVLQTAPVHTFQSVGRMLAEGLEDGSIVLDNFTERT